MKIKIVNSRSRHVWYYQESKKPFKHRFERRRKKIFYAVTEYMGEPVDERGVLAVGGGFVYHGDYIIL